MIEIGTSGFRGIDGVEINEEVVSIIAQTACQIIHNGKLKKEIVVGFDKRAHSRLYAHTICRVLVANKIKATVCAYAEPSPLVSLVAKQRKTDIALMVTASHNPYKYNGIKIFGKGGVDVSSDLEEQFNKLSKEIKIEDVKIVSWQQCQNNPLFVLKNFEEDYVDSILSQIKYMPSGLKVIFETMNGSSNRVTSLLAKKLKGNEIIVKNIKFANGKELSAPIPTKDNIDYLLGELKEKNMLFAYATDGDGDRLALLSKDGTYYDSTYIAMLIYEFAVQKKGEQNGFVGNQSFSSLGKKVCKDLNRPYYESKIGYKNISQKMIETGSNYSAENSSMCVASHTPFKDGILGFALLLEVLSFEENKGKSFDQIVADFKARHNFDMVYSEMSYRLPDGAKTSDYVPKILDFEPNFAQKSYKKQILDSNVKFVFDDGSWLLLRPSGTENCVRFVSENFSMDNNKQMTECIKSALEKHLKITFKPY